MVSCDGIINDTPAAGGWNDPPVGSPLDIGLKCYQRRGGGDGAVAAGRAEYAGLTCGRSRRQNQQIHLAEGREFGESRGSRWGKECRRSTWLGGATVSDCDGGRSGGETHRGCRSSPGRRCSRSRRRRRPWTACPRGKRRAAPSRPHSSCWPGTPSRVSRPRRSSPE